MLISLHLSILTIGVDIIDPNDSNSNLSMNCCAVNMNNTPIGMINKNADILKAILSIRTANIVDKIERGK